LKSAVSSCFTVICCVGVSVVWCSERHCVSSNKSGVDHNSSNVCVYSSRVDDDVGGIRNAQTADASCPDDPCRDEVENGWFAREVFYERKPKR
jgi:hypothetical protein